MTVSDLVTSSLRVLGAIDPADTPSTTELDNGREALNLLLSRLSTDLGQYKDTREMFSLTADKGEYTIGDGGDFDTDRPIRVTAAYVRLNGVDYPLEFMDHRHWSAISDKDTSGRPTRLYYDDNYPLGTFFFYPYPDQSYTLYLHSYKEMGNYTANSDDIALPPPYEYSLKYLLAVNMADEYGRNITQTLAGNAQDAAKTLKKLNSQPVKRIATDLMKRGRRYDIYSDT